MSIPVNSYTDSGSFRTPIPVNSYTNSGVFVHRFRSFRTTEIGVSFLET